jgi:hypothetical protein
MGHLNGFCWGRISGAQTRLTAAASLGASHPSPPTRTISLSDRSLRDERPALESSQNLSEWLVNG